MTALTIPIETVELAQPSKIEASEQSSSPEPSNESDSAEYCRAWWIANGERINRRKRWRRTRVREQSQPSRSELVAAAAKRVPNRYELARLTVRGVRAMHKPHDRIQQTMDVVLGIIGNRQL